MVLVAPSLLSADFGNLRAEVAELEKSGADWLHLDVMDGHFVPNLTFGPQLIKTLRRDSLLLFDTHLMVENPDKMLPWFAEAGADILTVHFEACNNPVLTLRTIRQLGKKSGISIRPQTDIRVIEPLLDEIDLILIMTVNPGFGGQSFMADQLAKIDKARRIIGDKNIILEVDGGINQDTGLLCQKAGADVLVAGSYVFSNHAYAKNIAALKNMGD